MFLVWLDLQASLDQLVLPGLDQLDLSEFQVSLGRALLVPQALQVPLGLLAHRGLQEHLGLRGRALSDHPVLRHTSVSLAADGRGNKSLSTPLSTEVSIE